MAVPEKGQIKRTAFEAEVDIVDYRDGWKSARQNWRFRLHGGCTKIRT